MVDKYSLNYSLNGLNTLLLDKCNSDLKKQFEANLVMIGDEFHISVRNIVNNKVANFQIQDFKINQFKDRNYCFVYWIKENEKWITGPLFTLNGVLDNKCFGWLVRILGDHLNYYDYRPDDKLGLVQLSLF